RSKAQQPEPAAALPAAIPVRVMKVSLRDMSDIIEYAGDIKARAEVAVYPKVSGKIIEKVKEEGSFVRQGEAIIYIDRDEVGQTFEKAPVESPLSGFIGRVSVDIGSYVTAQTAVAVVIDMEQVKINLDLPEVYLPRVFLGQEAVISLDAYPDKEYRGKVTKISPLLDIGTRTAPVEITVNNQLHELKSGMFARVRLIMREYKNVPVVLKEALVGSAGDYSVYLIREQKALLQKVSAGLQQGPFVQILEGIEEGDNVVVVGQQKLFEGASVIAEE
ncbi:MAG: efflux RND transporter periplasmic adaptor subunit, partial [Candidatus Omnitrophota bacterium]